MAYFATQYRRFTLRQPAIILGSLSLPTFHHFSWWLPSLPHKMEGVECPEDSKGLNTSKNEASGGQPAVSAVVSR